MPAYVIAETTIIDAKAFDIYRAHAEKSIVKHGGRYLARGGEIAVLEGGRSPRITVVEFSSMDVAQKWYQSPDYASALAIRDQALTRNLFIVDGVASIPM